MFKVTLKSGKAWLVKATQAVNDGRRVTFINSNGHIIRSWLVENLESWEEAKEV